MVSIIKRLLLVTVLGLTQIPVHSMQAQSFLTKDALISFAKTATASPLVQNFAKPVASFALSAGISWGVQRFLFLISNKAKLSWTVKEIDNMSPREKILFFLGNVSTGYFYSSLDNWLQIRHLGLKKYTGWSKKQYAATWIARLIGPVIIQVLLDTINKKNQRQISKQDKNK